MKHLILVRHGESDWNVERRIQGQLGTGLSDRGHEQAAATAQWLAQTFPDAALFTSDLQRCRETAAPLERALGRGAAPLEGLRERDYGSWQGRLTEDVRRDEGDRYGRWVAGEDIMGELGGEDNAVFRKRVGTTLESILADLSDDGVAVCISHGGPVWYGTSEILALHDPVLGAVANASVTELLVDADAGRRLASWNQTTHLPAGLRTWLRRVEPARRPSSVAREA